MLERHPDFSVALAVLLFAVSRKVLSLRSSCAHLLRARTLCTGLMQKQTNLPLSCEDGKKIRATLGKHTVRHRPSCKEAQLFQESPQRLEALYFTVITIVKKGQSPLKAQGND